MDARLRRYLEHAVPRPPLVHPNHDERRQLWLFPLGAAITLGIIIGHIVAEQRSNWGTAALIWLLLVVGAALLARKAHALTQAIYRNGTLTDARVVSTEVELESEDRTLVVTFRSALARGEGYRDAGRADLLFRATLTDRWIVEPNHAPFLRDASFPMLVSPDRRLAKIFVHDEEIDAARV